MAIREKTNNGVKVFEVSLGLRSKIKPEVRVQKLRKNIPTLKEAMQIEKQLIRECSAELARAEGSGITFEEVLEKFELAHRKNQYGLKPMQLHTLFETISTLRLHGKEILKMNCQDISPADVRKIFQSMEDRNYTFWRINDVKKGFNKVYKWAVESREVVGVLHSPAQFVNVTKARDTKPSQVLNFKEIQKLLAMAKELEHPWYPVWFTALNTGMRSGELYALEWADIDFEGKLITVSKNYSSRGKIIKSTKSGYWRKIPMNAELEELLLDLKSKRNPDQKEVLPRLTRWKRGEGAKFLREFCEDIGITSVNFHALRACFATHMLNAGVASPVVKKICGWTEEKVMTRYIRLAGIDVAGATATLGFSKAPLDRVKPKEEEVAKPEVLHYEYSKVLNRRWR